MKGKGTATPRDGAGRPKPTPRSTSSRPSSNTSARRRARGGEPQATVRPATSYYDAPGHRQPGMVSRGRRAARGLGAFVGLVVIAALVVLLVTQVFLPALDKVADAFTASDPAVLRTGSTEVSATEEAEDGETEDTEEEAEETTTEDDAATAMSVASTTVEERLAACDAWTPQSPEDFSDIVDVEGVYGFDLASYTTNTASEDAEGAEALQSTATEDSEQSPTLSFGSVIQLACAMVPYEQAEVPYGFLVMDLETGRGFACNLDSEVYGASSFKAAFCAFVGEEFIDEGDYALSSTISSTTSTGSGYAYSGTDTIENLMYNTIVYSSNEAFVSLRLAFDDASLAAWLSELGVDSSIAYDTSFPHYTTRDAARLWLELYQYLDTDSEVAALIAECTAATETSFLRDALADLEDVSVSDKAGWNSDSDSTDGVDYNAICDNGIVTYNGRDYLVCVMLGASYADSTLDNAERLMAAVFAAHEDLA